MPSDATASSTTSARPSPSIDPTVLTHLPPEARYQALLQTNLVARRRPGPQDVIPSAGSGVLLVHDGIVCQRIPPNEPDQWTPAEEDPLFPKHLLAPSRTVSRAVARTARAVVLRENRIVLSGAPSKSQQWLEFMSSDGVDNHNDDDNDNDNNNNNSNNINYDYDYDKNGKDGPPLLRHLTRLDLRFSRLDVDMWDEPARRGSVALADQFAALLDFLVSRLDVARVELCLDAGAPAHETYREWNATEASLPGVRESYASIARAVARALQQQRRQRQDGDGEGDGDGVGGGPGRRPARFFVFWAAFHDLEAWAERLVMGQGYDALRHGKTPSWERNPHFPHGEEKWEGGMSLASPLTTATAMTNVRHKI